MYFTLTILSIYKKRFPRITTVLSRDSQIMLLYLSGQISESNRIVVQLISTTYMYKLQFLILTYIKKKKWNPNPAGEHHRFRSFRASSWPAIEPKNPRKSAPAWCHCAPAVKSKSAYIDSSYISYVHIQYIIQYTYTRVTYIHIYTHRGRLVTIVHPQRGVRSPRRLHSSRGFSKLRMHIATSRSHHGLGYIKIPARLAPRVLEIDARMTGTSVKCRDCRAAFAGQEDETRWVLP